MLNITLVGDPKVGKTSIFYKKINKYPDSISTNIKHEIFNDVTIRLYDTPSNKYIKNDLIKYYKDIVIIVCDATKIESFENIYSWILKENIKYHIAITNFTKINSISANEIHFFIHDFDYTFIDPNNSSTIYNMYKKFINIPKNSENCFSKFLNYFF